MIKKWIRWKGLLGFAIASVLLLLIFMLLVDTFIKDSIEYTGTRLVGARVELDSAEFRFSPLGIKLARLQVTNPEQPTHNIFDIKHIAFDLDGVHLLRRKILIRQMTLDGVRLNTRRKTSGALGGKGDAVSVDTPETDKDNDLKLPDINIPNPDKILAQEELKTTKQAEKLKSLIKSNQQHWNRIKQSTSIDRHIDEYNKQLEKIRNINSRDTVQLAAALKKLKHLKQQIKKDIQHVDSSRQQISAELNQLANELQALQNSPVEEYRRLIDKYSTSTNSIGNISHLLFGNDAKKYTAMGIGWYKRLAPWLAYAEPGGEQGPTLVRQQGVNVRFREYNPAPELYIKEIHASIETRQDRFAGKIMDVSNEQHITRRPTSLRFSADNMQDIGSILLTGSFNHIEPARSKDQLNLKLTDYRLNQHHLIDKDDMSIYLDQAKSDIRLNIKRDDSQIMADFKSHIHSIKYNNHASGNELAMMFLASINRSRDFNIYGKLRGTLDDYSTEISSDLDNRLKANMQQHMARRLADFRKQLKDKIHLQTRQPIHEAEGRLKDLQSVVNNDIAMHKAKLIRQFNLTETE